MTETKTKDGDPPENGKSSATLATSVYDRLRHDVLTGLLRPGEKLRTDFLRDRYQIGNSPVREALNRLSADGLVEREDQRGFRVASVSKDDLFELVKTRCWMEEVAIRESISNANTEWEEGLVIAFHRLSRFPRSSNDGSYSSDPEWEHLHRAFHIALISGCRSQRLVTFCEELFDKAERYRRLAASGVPERNERDEHQAIMDAALNGDTDEVAKLLREHYGRTVQVILASGIEFLASESDTNPDFSISPAPASVKKKGAP